MLATLAFVQIELRYRELKEIKFKNSCGDNSFEFLSKKVNSDYMKNGLFFWNSI